MARAAPVHILTEVDPERRTAVCAHCGPVRIKSGGRQQKWKCIEAARQYRSHPVAVDRAHREAITEESVCERCGFVPEWLGQLDVHKHREYPHGHEILCANCHRLETRDEYTSSFGGSDRIRGVTAKERIAWAAGFLDGEGSITIQQKDGRYYWVKVTAAQKVMAPLEILKDLFGGSIHTEKTSGLHAWQTSCALAGAMLAQVEPFMVVKRDQAQLALAFQSRRRASTREQDHEDFLLIRQLKRCT